MPGMYPDDRWVEIFGDRVIYPGLDPITGKFTDGDFFDLLVKPSHIPAETFNLILDNLNDFIAAHGCTPNNSDTNQLTTALKFALANRDNENHPIGSSYVQHFNDPDPLDRGLPGYWALWTARAEGYRLAPNALPAYTAYTAGANYADNAYVSFHLPGAGWELFKAKAAVTNAAAQLDPVLWEKYEQGSIVERRLVQGWLDDDLALGALVEGGDYAGLRVAEVICLGGTFDSWEGGNRPTANYYRCPGAFDREG